MVVCATSICTNILLLLEGIYAKFHNAKSIIYQRIS